MLTKPVNRKCSVLTTGIQMAFALLVSVLFTTELSAQRDSTILEFSGKIVTEEDGDLVPVPQAAIYIKDAAWRGTAADDDGFFSLAARKGETVVFEALGYLKREFNIPDTLIGDRFSFFPILARDTISLPEIVIYPWPRREHFEIDFLAMDVTDELQEIAQENVAQDKIFEAMAGLAADGDEFADLYFKQQSQSYYTAGQFRTSGIFNVLAWQKFIKAWKDGDFKNKKKKKNN